MDARRLRGLTVADRGRTVALSHLAAPSPPSLRNGGGALGAAARRNLAASPGSRRRLLGRGFLSAWMLPPSYQWHNFKGRDRPFMSARCQ
eukprot:scaffold13618_cov66-Phaeocystis_antarctica.AAC.2